MKDKTDVRSVIKRSDLWKKIYEVVSQIPRKNTKWNAMDYSSASTELESLFTEMVEKATKLKFDEVNSEFKSNGCDCGQLGCLICNP